jgi:hypothetical protein
MTRYSHFSTLAPQRHMNAPLRCFAYYADEPTPCWWTTTNHGRTFERATGDRIVVPLADLVWESHGLNDQELYARFPKQQLARYQPHR